MSTSQFDQYKLKTKFCDGYYEHSIITETSVIVNEQRERKSEQAQRWSREKMLGRGGFGTVWLEKESKGTFRAVKQISKTNLWDTRELAALTELKVYPEYFVQFLGWFENEDSIYLTMEYIQYGDLDSLIIQNEMTEADAKVITTQILKGLKIMHEKNFCHRDLKPQNILVVSLSPIHVKISDFGASKKIMEGTDLRTTIGTSNYVAPEIMGYLASETSAYTSAVDIWSLGCLVHAIITMETPFIHTRALLNYIEGLKPFPESKLIGRNASPAAIRFIISLVMPHGEDRLTAEQALEATWLHMTEGASTVTVKVTPKATPNDGPREDLMEKQEVNKLSGRIADKPMVATWRGTSTGGMRQQVRSGRGRMFILPPPSPDSVETFSAPSHPPPRANTAPAVSSKATQRPEYPLKKQDSLPPDLTKLTRQLLLLDEHEEAITPAMFPGPGLFEVFQNRPDRLGWEIGRELAKLTGQFLPRDDKKETKATPAIPPETAQLFEVLQQTQDTFAQGFGDLEKIVGKVLPRNGQEEAAEVQGSSFSPLSEDTIRIRGSGRKLQPITFGRQQQQRRQR